MANSKPGLLSLWFRFDADAGRRAYVLSGFGLMAIKFAVETLVVRSQTGTWLGPLDFVDPAATRRYSILETGPDWMGPAWLLWSLPFLWIALSMSVRRARDAGWSPCIGLAVVVPFANLLVMLVLASLPANASAPTRQWRDGEQRAHSVLIGIALSIGIVLTVIGVNVYALNTYGASLFVGAPVLIGATTAAVYNYHTDRTYRASIGVALLSVICCGAALLLFALEGVICLIMAAPIALLLAALGGMLGKFIADCSMSPARGIAASLLVLPIWGGGEALLQPAHELRVVTAIEIDAPIERVWDVVIAFPDMGEPEEWYFRAGIACPMRARIDGEGVGAIRHCVFTTGAFVEPITAWDKPHRLAFDVTEQPAPMFELSPYRHVHPPHLDNALRSNRGEFRLERVQSGRTRLVGTTWYEFDMFPRQYWSLWSNAMIGAIHRRVLLHIKAVAESDQG